jgi:hypothetical protein
VIFVSFVVTNICAATKPIDRSRILSLHGLIPHSIRHQPAKGKNQTMQDTKSTKEKILNEPFVRILSPHQSSSIGFQWTGAKHASFAPQPTNAGSDWNHPVA